MTDARILIVEDETIVAMEIRAQLVRFGYHVTEICKSPSRVMAALRAHLPDLVFMDIHLGEAVSGIDLAEKIREKYDLPIIFLTAFTDDPTVFAALKTNPFGYIQKPFKRDDLKVAVELALNKHGYEKRLTHLNDVLLSLRRIRKLAPPASAPGQWIQKICRELVDGGGYQRAWMILTDDQNAVTGFKSAGKTRGPRPTQKTLPLSCPFTHGKIPGAIAGAAVENCSEDCFFSEVSKEPMTLCAPVHSDACFFGVLNIGLSFVPDNAAQEGALAAEVASEVGLALYTMEIKKEKALAALEQRESKKRYMDLVDMAPVPILSLNKTGTITEANEAALKLVGLNRLEYVGHHFTKLPIFSAGDLPELINRFFNIVSGKEPLNGLEFSFRRADGVQAVGTAYVRLLRDNRRRVSGIQAVIIDKTEQLTAEKQRRENEAALSSIFQAVPIGIGQAASRMLLRVNDELLRITGYQREALIGQSIRLLYPSRAEYDRVGRVLYDRIRKDGSGMIETRWKNKDGTVKDILLGAAGIDRKDPSLGIIFSALDITERKQNADRQYLALQVFEVLNKSGGSKEIIEKILHLIRDSTGIDALGIRLREGEHFPFSHTIGIDEGLKCREHDLTIDGKGPGCTYDGTAVDGCVCRDVLCGKTDARHTCFTAGGTFWTSAADEWLAGLEKKRPGSHILGNCYEAGYRSIACVPLRVGDEIIGIFVLYDKRSGVFNEPLIALFEGLGNSIGLALERQRSRDALWESEVRFRQIADNIEEAFFLMDRATDSMLYVSPVCAQICGGVVSFETHGAGALIHHIHPEDLPHMAFADGQKRYESVIDEEFRLLVSDQPVRWLRIRTFPIHDDRGQVYRLAGIVSNITVFKEAEEERRRHQDHLIQADKMVSLGTLVSGVAHEINNPNNSIVMNTPILEKIWTDMLPAVRKYADTDTDTSFGGFTADELFIYVPQLLKGIKNGGDRIKRIVFDLKNFARKDTRAMNETVHMNAVVERSLSLLANLIKKSTDALNLNLAENLPPFRGNNQRIDQVVINLIQNACQSLTAPKNGIFIETAYDPALDRITLRIKDDGIGIPPDRMKFIKVPFCTTRRDTGGTGLGLSVSDGIVRDHGGTMIFESEEGKGTLVTLSFPRQSGETHSREVL